VLWFIEKNQTVHDSELTISTCSTLYHTLFHTPLYKRYILQCKYSIYTVYSVKFKIKSEIMNKIWSLLEIVRKKPINKTVFLSKSICFVKATHDDVWACVPAYLRTLKNSASYHNICWWTACSILAILGVENMIHLSTKQGPCVLAFPEKHIHSL
jgi:hypothetical protein